MFAQSRAEASPSSPTYYEILGISEELVTLSPIPLPLLKRAYHRALLQHHPDKRDAGRQTPRDGQGSISNITVDQITEAFEVLSSPAKRADYDRTLRLAATQSRQQHASNGRGCRSVADFQTGIETVDLDELAHDELQDVWYRGCRCGNERGYAVTAEDLEAEAETGELLVGCQDCSLWLRVHFVVLDGDADGGEDDEGQAGQNRADGEVEGGAVR